MSKTLDESNGDQGYDWRKFKFIKQLLGIDENQFHSSENFNI